MPTQLFINYRQDDSAGFAEYLRSCLAAEMGDESVFLDKESIAYGTGVAESIWPALEAAQMLLVVAGPRWVEVLDDDGERRLRNEEDWVRREIEFAQEKSKDILLVLYNQTSFQETAAYLARKVRTLAFLGGKKYYICNEATQKTDVDRLIAELRKQPGLRFRPAGTVSVPGPPPTLREQLEAEFSLPPDHPLPPAQQPFKALHYFEREDARIFFGRTDETLTLCRAVQRFPLVLLYGQSGTGKSSLLNAGLLPRIEARFTTHYLRRQREPGLPAQILAWRDSYQSGGKPPLLLLDQVEEMYTHPRADRREEAEALAPLLRELLKKVPGLHLLLAFRSEHIAPIKDLMAAQGLIPSSEQELFLKALNAKGVEEALGGIAADATLSNYFRLEVAPGLIARMTRDILAPQQPESHIAPLLQYQLEALWTRLVAATQTDHERVRLTEEAYEAIRQDSLDALIDAELEGLAAEHPDWQAFIDNGLIWNLLYRYTTDLGTARERLDAEVLARHPHIPGFDALFAVLKHRCRLMIPCGKAAAPATRLAHDALAPLLQARRAASDAPGPRALRIVEIKERELKAGKSEFSETDLEAVEAGQLGMAQVPDAVQQRMAQDRARYQQARAQRFALAFATAQADYEHLRFRACLDNLRLAAREGIEADKVADLLAQLPWVFKFLKDEAGLAGCRELNGGHLPEIDEAAMRKRFFPTMKPVPGGSFDMGSEEGYADEKPVHRVTVSSFEAGETPVTCWQYGLYCLATGLDLPRDSGFGRADRPVVNITWHEAARYCHWLSGQQGLASPYSFPGKDTVKADWEADGYRLPTEAEWEYAAREGGRKLRFGNGQDTARASEMNYDYQHPYNDKPYIEATDQKGQGQTSPVYRYAPNALGLYDMSGNAYDWCWDRWSEGDYYQASEGATDPRGPETSESRRVVRGGSWLATADYCRSSYRDGYRPFAQDNNIGCRVFRRSS